MASAKGTDRIDSLFSPSGVRPWCSRVLSPQRVAFGPCVVGEISGDNFSTTIIFDCLQLRPPSQKNTSRCKRIRGQWGPLFSPGARSFFTGVLFFLTGCVFWGAPNFHHAGARFSPPPPVFHHRIGLVSTILIRMKSAMLSVMLHAFWHAQQNVRACSGKGGQAQVGRGAEAGLGKVEGGFEKRYIEGRGEQRCGFLPGNFGGWRV